MTQLRQEQTHVLSIIVQYRQVFRALLYIVYSGGGWVEEKTSSGYTGTEPSGSQDCSRVDVEYRYFSVQVLVLGYSTVVANPKSDQLSA